METLRSQSGRGSTIDTVHRINGELVDTVTVVIKLTFVVKGCVRTGDKKRSSWAVGQGQRQSKKDERFPVDDMLEVGVVHCREVRHN